MRQEFRAIPTTACLLSLSVSSILVDGIEEEILSQLRSFGVT